MLIEELKKDNLEEVSGSLSKYVIDSEAIVNLGFLDKQIINDKETVVIKVSNISNDIDNEIKIYKILIKNNIVGILEILDVL
jgi:dTDP-D-glucose 4,6-dehydratase